MNNKNRPLPIMVIKAKTQPDQFTETISSKEMVKVVVDIEREVLSLGCELHVDCAEELEQDGSSMKNLWGANVYPVRDRSPQGDRRVSAGEPVSNGVYPADWRIDFVSLINIRPLAGNRSMEIQDTEIRRKVEVIIRELLF